MCATVDGTGTRRRIQALVAAGHGTREIDAALAGTAPPAEQLISGAGPVAARTAQAVAAVFADLQMTPGRSESARRRGRAGGWPLPLEWDEDQIDDPEYVPERSRRTRGTADPTDRRERVAEWMDAQARGLSTETAAQVAQRLNITTRTVDRDKAWIREARKKAAVQQREAS